jgi:hypothetical protein
MVTGRGRSAQHRVCAASTVSHCAATAEHHVVDEAHGAPVPRPKVRCRRQQHRSAVVPQRGVARLRQRPQVVGVHYLLARTHQYCALMSLMWHPG